MSRAWTSFAVVVAVVAACSASSESSPIAALDSEVVDGLGTTPEGSAALDDAAQMGHERPDEVTSGSPVIAESAREEPSSLGDSAQDVPTLSGADSTDEGPPLSPLQQLLGVQVVARDVAAHDYATRVNQRHDTYVRCVREHGYDWFDPPPEVVNVAAFTGPLPTERENLIAVAYGIRASVRIALEVTAPSELSPHQVAAIEATQGWSEAQIDAYADARRSCTDLAWDRHTEPGAPAASAALLEEIDRVLDDISNNPAYLTILDDWSRCMAAEGYDFATRTDIAEWIISLDPDALRDYHTAAAAAAAAQTGTIPAASQQRIDRLLDHEARILEADLVCSDDTDFFTRWSDLTWELEEQAIQENGDRWAIVIGELDS